MQLINPQRFHTLIEDAQAAGFCGWDFSWLSGRMCEEAPPWDYTRLVREYLRGADRMLDLGTGGGEFLASLPVLPAVTHATESYPPNQSLAAARLAPLGVQVHPTTDGNPLPFTKDYFALIINRHESYNPAEVYRVLKPGGVFITQQVGALDNLEINQALEDSISFPLTNWGLPSAANGLGEVGFRVSQAESAALRTLFYDIGALIYYMKAIPWQVEDFNVARYEKQLAQLHNFIECHGVFITTAHRFLIIAHKEAIQQ